jgi:hypothetical protein
MMMFGWFRLFRLCNSRVQPNVIGWQCSRGNVRKTNILPSIFLVQGVYCKMAAAIAERSVGKKVNCYATCPGILSPAQPRAINNFATLISCTAEVLGNEYISVRGCWTDVNEMFVPAFTLVSCSAYSSTLKKEAMFLRNVG